VAADTVSVEVLEERFAGLQVWLDERFARLDDRFNQLANNRFGDADRLDAQFEQISSIRSGDVDRVSKLVLCFGNHEARLVKLERIAWLLVRLSIFFAPVVIWAIIEIIKAIIK
jgi:hypothetical protein